jgi:hypothetical protein
MARCVQETAFAQMQTSVSDIRRATTECRVLVESQLPFAYVHLLTVIVKVHFWRWNEKTIILDQATASRHILHWVALWCCFQLIYTAYLRFPCFFFAVCLYLACFFSFSFFLFFCAPIRWRW